MPSTLPEQTVAAGPAFWPDAADAVLQLGAQAGGGNAADLRGIDIVVPTWGHAPMLRAALHARLAALGHARLIPPRLYTLEAWAGEVRDDTLERRVELFDALRANDWIRSIFGTQPAALWALAAQVAANCDELTFAAVDGADAFAERLQASVARHFHRRAARVVQPQAHLVLHLWRAGLARGGAASARLAALQSRCESATHPLLLIALRPLLPWMQGWLGVLARRVPVRILRADIAGAVAQRPLFAAAWPELQGGSVEAALPIGERARALDMASAADGPEIVEVHSLEDEALVVAERVAGWLQGEAQARRSPGSRGGTIALIAIDRIVARRVRALLERAQIVVRDETGWKLSTTSAAGVVMRLFDLAVEGFAHRDLLDWLKSPFTMYGEAARDRIVQAIERTIRERGIVRGLDALLEALGDTERPSLGPSERATAVRWLHTLHRHADRLGSATGTAASRARALDAALGELGMRAGLQRDPVGKQVLRELDAIRDHFAAGGAIGNIRLAPREFRSLIATRFEEVACPAETVDSPVVVVSLAAAAMRDFDAAVLLGVDAAHLPSLTPDLLFFSRSVRAELGLPGPKEARREQLSDLASVLLRVPQVIATWRSKEGDEPRALCDWFTRLHAVAAAAGARLIHEGEPRTMTVAAAGMQRPAPIAPERLPQCISATEYQSLVDCPYQFFARYLLRLRPLDEISDEPQGFEFGRAVHTILQRFHDEWRGTDLREVDPGELAASLARHTDEVFEPLVARQPRLLARRGQFSGVQLAYLDWLRQRTAQGWRFRQAEAKAQAQIEVAAAGTVRLVTLHGRVDRIDERDGEIEVLDYKTMRREALVEKLRAAGEDVQLPFYGLICSPRPSGAVFLYMQRTSNEHQAPVDRVGPPQPYAELVAALQVRLRSDLQGIINGAALPAHGNDATCRYCRMRGLCRRDFWQAERQG